MGPRVQKESVSSQATPLAEDVLKLLQGQIAQGAFGQGAGPLQRNAGTALEQYLSSIQGRVSSGGDTPQTSQLITALTRNSNTNANRQAADLREGFGIAGNRFGSAGALGEARLRGDIASNLDQTIGGIRTQQSQFDAGQLLNSINLLQNMGNQNIAPFLQLAQLGILPEELLVQPGIGDQLVSAGINGLAAYASGGASAAMPGGGPAPNASPQVFTSPNRYNPQLFPSAGQPSGIGMSGAGNAGPFQFDPRLLGG